MTGHDPDGPGDDADGTEHPEEPPSDGWPAEWTPAEDTIHLAPDDERTSSDGDERTPSDGDERTPSDGDERTPSDGDERTPSDGDERTPSDDDISTAEPDPVTGSSGETDVEASGDGPVANSGRAAPPGATGNRGGPEHRERASRPDKPPALQMDDQGPSISDDGPVTWFMQSEHSGIVMIRDIVSSVAAVALIGLILFAISGVWPPLVAVESGSMEPHMSKGDLVFIVEETRFSPDSSVMGTGVSTYESARTANDYQKFGSAGDVVVFRPDGRDRSTPIIHRARFYVEADEDWYDRADPKYLGSANSCEQIPNDMCPAPYDGFITKGDANPRYDQVGDQSGVVKPEWIRGKAKVRIPFLGWIRLQFANLAATGALVPSSVGAFVVRLTALGTLGVAYGVSTGK